MNRKYKRAVARDKKKRKDTRVGYVEMARKALREHTSKLAKMVSKAVHISPLYEYGSRLGFIDESAAAKLATKAKHLEESIPRRWVLAGKDRAYGGSASRNDDFPSIVVNPLFEVGGYEGGLKVPINHIIESDVDDTALLREAIKATIFPNYTDKNALSDAISGDTRACFVVVRNADTKHLLSDIANMVQRDFQAGLLCSNTDYRYSALKRAERRITSTNQLVLTVTVTPLKYIFGGQVTSLGHPVGASVEVGAIDGKSGTILGTVEKIIVVKEVSGSLLIDGNCPTLGWNPSSNGSLFVQPEEMSIIQSYRHRVFGAIYPLDKSFFDHLSQHGLFKVQQSRREE